MKILGLIGGLSWYSTAVYYKKINEEINKKLSGSHSAQLLLYSVDLDEFKTLHEKNRWDIIEPKLTEIAKKLETAGASCIIITSNTPHIVADQISEKIKIPIIHIAEETAKEIEKFKFKKVGLLGTKFTMETSFFKDRLLKKGINAIVPENFEREFIDNSIFNELTKGIFKEETKKKYFEIIEKLKTYNIEGVIFGCTEISLLINQEECDIKIFDTTTIHTNAAVNYALS